MTGTGGIADGVQVPMESEPQCPKCSKKGVMVGAVDDPSQCPSCGHSWKGQGGNMIAQCESFGKKLDKIFFP